GYFVIFEASQRGAFARDACLVAELHQLLAIDFQIFRERVNPNGHIALLCRAGLNFAARGCFYLLFHGRVLLCSSAPRKGTGATAILPRKRGGAGTIDARSIGEEHPRFTRITLPPGDTLGIPRRRAA